MSIGGVMVMDRWRNPGRLARGWRGADIRIHDGECERPQSENPSTRRL